MLGGAVERSGGVEAVKALQIIGIVSVVLVTFVGVVVLPIMAKFLKKAHGVFREKARDIPNQLGATVESIGVAQGQIDALIATTASVKSGMEAAIGLADRAIAFLSSTVFQVGLPAVLWALFLIIALPRGLRRRKKKGPKIRPVPPPSWEREQE